MSVPDANEIKISAGGRVSGSGADPVARRGVDRSGLPDGNLASLRTDPERDLRDFFQGARAAEDMRTRQDIARVALNVKHPETN